MSGFDKEKWRAELEECSPDAGNDVVFIYDALALLERAYSEGRAEGESAALSELENHLPSEHHGKLTAGCFKIAREALAAARGTP